MNAVNEALARIHLGKPQTHRNLFLFPLLTQEGRGPSYLTLDEALRAGCARVTETSAHGSVPELRFVNDCERPVLLLDGEDLLGAKQNRILNVSVLAPAKTTLTIPVSCVEAGRWHATSSEFRPSGRAHFASGRAAKLQAVSASLRESRSYRGDQGKVWADIEVMAQAMDAPSPTHAAEALYETHRDRLDGYQRAFAPLPGQAGALFAVGEIVVGLDLFDAPPTLAKSMPKLVESYALDAIARNSEPPHEPPREAAIRFLDALGSARTERYPPVGLGETLRMTSPALSGAALAVDERVIHLCAFAHGEETYEEYARGRIASPWTRGRR